MNKENQQHQQAQQQLSTGLPGEGGAGQQRLPAITKFSSYSSSSSIGGGLPNATSSAEKLKRLSEFDELIAESEDILGVGASSSSPLKNHTMTRQQSKPNTNNLNDNDSAGHINSADKLGDSLDFENSDDLNNIISKYEKMLDKPKVTPIKVNKQSAAEVDDLDDADDWTESPSGSSPRNDGPNAITDELEEQDELTASMEEQIEVEKQLQEDVDYDEDIIDDVELDDIVEQEMKSQKGKEDQQKLRDIINLSRDSNSPAGQKSNKPIEEKFNNAKASPSKTQTDEDEEIDEFIKKHLEDEKTEPEKSASQRERDAIDSENSSDSSSSSALSPRQSLLNALLKLSEPNSATNKYSLNDRELFVFDLESILKVLTFKETCLLIFPCLEIYACEQEYLKIELFRQLPHVFAKIMNGSGKLNEQLLKHDQKLDILTVNLFPLISQLMMISDETVQTAGVEALLKVHKDKCLGEEDGLFLMQNVQSILFKKCQVFEQAKSGGLLMLEQFCKADIFGKDVVDEFITDFYEEIQKDAGFKTKAKLLQCLLAICKHLSPDQVLLKVFNVFRQYSQPDEVWGLRKLCLQLAPEMVSHLDSAPALLYILDFLKLSLKPFAGSTSFSEPSSHSKSNAKQNVSSDDNVTEKDEGVTKKNEFWVRNQAMQYFGQIIHAVHQKKSIAPKDLQNRIRDVTDYFYDLALVKGNMSKEPEITESFMANEDSTDKLKEMWAFNLPCALLVNTKDYWPKLKPIYEEIYRDLQISIKRSLAASLIEIGKIHLDQDFLLEVIRHFLLSDLAEVNQKIVPNLIDFVQLYPEDRQMDLVNALIKPQLEMNVKNLKHRQVRCTLINQLFTKLNQPVTLLVEEGYHKYVEETVKSDPLIANRRALAEVYGTKILSPLIKNKKYRKDLTDFIDDLRTSKNFRERQMYITVGEFAYLSDPEIFKKHFAKSMGIDMLEEKVKVVQITLAKMIFKVKEGEIRSVDKLRDHLKTNATKDVNQFLKEHNELRYINEQNLTVTLKAVEDDKEDDDEKAKTLKLNKEEDEETKEEKKEEEQVQTKISEASVTVKADKKEEESKDKDKEDDAEDDRDPRIVGDEELSQIQTYEKTVNIRFANYSVLVRAHQYGLNSQLLALLAGFGSSMGNMSSSHTMEGGKDKMLDASEEEMIKSKEKKDSDDSSWD